MSEEDYLALFARVEDAIEQFFLDEEPCDCPTCIAIPVMTTVSDFIDETYLIL